MLTWDAGPRGWAALLRWWEQKVGSWVLRELLLVGTWQHGSIIEFQPHREALAGCLATEAAEQEVDMRCSLVLYRNDAEAAISALSKGSFGSQEMQASALRLARVDSRSDINGRFYHVPGLSLVQEGVDGASRGDGSLGGQCMDAMLGPSVNGKMWKMTQAEVQKVGWRITMDLFATASNARVMRFCSRGYEPSAEHIDALAVPDWGSSLCPACSGRHREVMYAFPPQALTRAVARKAVQDGARIVLLVPLALTSPQWHKLVESSVVKNQDRYIRIRDPELMLENAAGYVPRELALFLCDLHVKGNGTDVNETYPACADAYVRRQRPPCGGWEDERDRLRLRDQLLRQEGDR